MSGLPYEGTWIWKGKNMRENLILLNLIRWITHRENELNKMTGNLRLSQKTEFDKGKIKFLNGKAQMCRDILEKVEELNEIN